MPVTGKGTTWNHRHTCTCKNACYSFFFPQEVQKGHYYPQQGESSNLCTQNPKEGNYSHSHRATPQKILHTKENMKNQSHQKELHQAGKS